MRPKVWSFFFLQVLLLLLCQTLKSMSRSKDHKSWKCDFFKRKMILKNLATLEVDWMTNFSCFTIKEISRSATHHDLQDSFSFSSLFFLKLCQIIVSNTCSPVHISFCMDVVTTSWRKFACMHTHHVFLGFVRGCLLEGGMSNLGANRKRRCNG